jgi:hypothetical protein
MYVRFLDIRFRFHDGRVFTGQGNTISAPKESEGYGQKRTFITFELSGRNEAEGALERLVMYMAAHSFSVVWETPVNFKMYLLKNLSVGRKT